MHEAMRCIAIILAAPISALVYTDRSKEASSDPTSGAILSDAMSNPFQAGVDWAKEWMKDDIHGIDYGANVAPGGELGRRIAAAVEPVGNIAKAAAPPQTEPAMGAEEAPPQAVPQKPIFPKVSQEPTEPAMAAEEAPPQAAPRNPIFPKAGQKPAAPQQTPMDAFNPYTAWMDARKPGRQQQVMDANMDAWNAAMQTTAMAVPDPNPWEGHN